jgi:predicted Fe-Mo cluster-binding NifX family protein
MRIAITSQNFKTITGHAGKTRRFLVYETDGQGRPTEVERIDLPAEMSLHAYHGDDHPLFLSGLEALITQGAGQGFLQRLSRHGIGCSLPVKPIRCRPPPGWRRDCPSPPGYRTTMIMATTTAMSRITASARFAWRDPASRPCLSSPRVHDPRPSYSMRVI